MNEKIRKGVGFGALASLAGVTLYFSQNESSGSAQTTITTIEVTTLKTYVDADILKPCRTAEDPSVIDQSCALEQAKLEIKSDDIVMAGIWAYHVTNSVLRTELDQLELTEAQVAVAERRFSDCVVWASRVIDPVLYEQLPVCE